MESKNNRYQSRILREMHQTTENPFTQPVSSTGTHGTVTLTSEFTSSPEGESTRRLDDMSIKLPNRPSTRSVGASRPQANVNTSTIGRSFPEWNKRFDKDEADLAEERDMWSIASDTDPNPDGKENVTPNTKATKVPMGSKERGSFIRTRAQMQPRVQTESECSADISEQLAHSQHGLQSRPTHTSQPEGPSPSAVKDSKPRRGNVTALLQTLKTARAKQADAEEQPASQPSPKSQSPEQILNAAQMHMGQRSPIGNSLSPATPNQTARSFFLPNLTHMNDFLSGTLRLSSFRNGIPIFVKYGKVHDRESNNSPDYHADIAAVAVPEDEEKIFVSLDKIREETHALKEHDDLVSKQAEQLQEEVQELHIQIAKYKSRKDSAMGSESDSSVIDHLNAQKSQLEEQVSSLQARLDKANRKISINEIHTESYINERDEALKNAAEHLEKIKHLQSELDSARKQLKELRNGTQDAKTLEIENDSLRNDNNSIRQKCKTLVEENRSLRSENVALDRKNGILQLDLNDHQIELDAANVEMKNMQLQVDVAERQNAVFKEDYLSLERNNDKFYNDNKSLRQENSVLERRSHDLKDEVARLKKLLDTANAKNGSVSVDVKDVRSRLETQNRKLARENAELQQQVIDLGLKCTTYEQETSRLAGVNERLNGQVDQISKLFDQVVHEGKKEVARYKEHHAALNQELDQIADKESALKYELKNSADREAMLQRQLTRKTEAIQEAREITQEIKKVMGPGKQNKTAKVTRIVEPDGKSAPNETSAKSTTSGMDIPIQEDYTQQINLTQGSDYASVFTHDEVPRLRAALRQARIENQQNDSTEESLAFEGELTEEISQSLPPLFVPQNPSKDANSRRTVSAASRGQADSIKSQPLGILKNAKPSRLNSQKQKATGTAPTITFEEPHELERTSESVPAVRKSKSDDAVCRKASGQNRVQLDIAKTRADNDARESGPAPEEDVTELSGMSIPSHTSREDVFHRRNSDSARFDIDTNHGENMTSELFIDDITLEMQKRSEKQDTQKPTAADSELSKDAKHVLDGLCHDHDCRNCIVCARIHPPRHEDRNVEGGAKKKKTVRIERPIPVTSRASRARPAVGEGYEDQSTLRPSQDPAMALAKVIKCVKDEERHIKSAIAKKQAVYDECDASVHRRLWKKLDDEMQTLRRVRELKRDQIYHLYDVLEAQKRSGQEMTDEYFDVTVSSILSRDPTWDGILGY
ncbi:hypothetical protein F4779DRAFT_604463 [Xylariaceae sp. FL0662B]|nr:hypothetical protein F4779DRAFT_604463 [Xylariaceae sp. FL0662B]